MASVTINNGCQDRLDVFLEEASIHGNASLKMLDPQLSKTDWLVLGRPTMADLSVFVYIALTEMGDISLKPYQNVLAWIKRVESLPGFFSDRTFGRAVAACGEVEGGW